MQPKTSKYTVKINTTHVALNTCSVFLSSTDDKLECRLWVVMKESYPTALLEHVFRFQWKLFLSLLNGYLVWWSTDLTLNLRRRFTAVMLKCKNPTSDLVLAILLVHKCWSWIRGWKLDTLAGISISKKQHSQAAVDLNRQSATVTEHSRFFRFFPLSYSSAAAQKRAWCSSQPT